MIRLAIFNPKQWVVAMGVVLIDPFAIVQVLRCSPCAKGEAQAEALRPIDVSSKLDRIALPGSGQPGARCIQMQQTQVCLMERVSRVSSVA